MASLIHRRFFFKPSSSIQSSCLISSSVLSSLSLNCHNHKLSAFPPLLPLTQYHQRQQCHTEVVDQRMVEWMNDLLWTMMMKSMMWPRVDQGSWQRQIKGGAKFSTPLRPNPRGLSGKGKWRNRGLFKFFTLLSMSLSSCWSCHVSSCFWSIFRKAMCVYDSPASAVLSEDAEIKRQVSDWQGLLLSCPSWTAKI